MEEKLVEIWQEHSCLFDVSPAVPQPGREKKKS